jgi:transposase-like protein
MEQRRKRARQKRFSAERRRELVQAWRDSGLTAAEYAQQLGMAKSNLWRWSSELGDMDKPADPSPKAARVPAFAAIAIEEAAMPAKSIHHALVCELEHPSGTRVRIYRGADMDVIRLLSDVMVRGGTC